MPNAVADFIADAPRGREALIAAAFPQVRNLITEDEYLSDTDENLLERWLNNKIVPAIRAANDEVKASLRYCLEPTAKAQIAAMSAGVNFVCGFLPHYPGGFAPAVAALVVLAAHELHDRGLI